MYKERQRGNQIYPEVITYTKPSQVAAEATYISPYLYNLYISISVHLPVHISDYISPYAFSGKYVFHCWFYWFIVPEPKFC